MDAARFLDSRLHQNLNRLAWLWILSIPLLIVTAFLSGNLDLNRQGSFDAGEMRIRSDEAEVSLPLESSEVTLQVTGMLVHGRTVQTFSNPTDRVIEAVYRFPLPETAAVHSMEMQIGPRRIVSVVREKEEAQRIYQAARAEGRKAARVEQDRPNLFTTAAANINPGEQVVVTLEYLQELEWEDGRFRLVYPLTYTPRFGGGDAEPEETGSLEGRAAPRVNLVVRIDAGLPLENVESTSHPVATHWEDSGLVVESPEDGLEANRDFILEWSLAGGRLPGVASFVEDRDDGRYAMLMVVPPAERFKESAGVSTDTLFILDVSGSMDGPSINAARSSLAAFLQSLDPRDRFRILLFNDRIRWLVREPVYASGSSLEQALDLVRSLAAGGGTDIENALAEGLAAVTGHDPLDHGRIELLTDGAVGNEDQVLRRIRKDLGGVRLHVLGIGAAPNRYLMRKMAAFGRGLCVFIAEPADAAEGIERFLGRLARPVLTDLELEFPGAGASVYPSRLPDLHRGQPLIISAKLEDAGSADAVLRGRLAGEEVQLSAEPGEGPATGVGVRWARARIDELMDSRHEGAAEESVRSQVVELALAFSLVTRYTSMVAVEEFASSPGEGDTCYVRSTAPAGWHGDLFLGRGGTSRPLLRLIGLGLLLGGALFLSVFRGV